MAEYGITGYGAYVPRLRIVRTAIAEAHKWMAPSLKAFGRDERAFASWDEDAITMAVEAGRDALGGCDRTCLQALTLVSTTLPYADLQNCAIAAGALALPQTVRAEDVGGSQRAGLAALSRALRSGTGDQLVLASDKLHAKPASTMEMTYGAGAAAFRLGSEGVIAKLLGTGTVTAPFIDHFRPVEGEHDYYWEERWIRDEGYSKLIPRAVKQALAEAGVGIADIASLVLAAPLKGAGALISKTLGFAGTVVNGLEKSVGYTGTAHPLLMLTGVLETAQPGDRILVVAFGQGAEALVLQVTEALPAFKPVRGLSGVVTDKVVTTDYLRMLSYYAEIQLEWGMRSEKSGKAALTTLYREAGQLAAFVAGKCGRCGTVQFPQLSYCVNPDCHAPAAGFVDLPLTEEPASMLTFTADWLSYHPAPPLYVGFVQFNVGARLLMEVVDIGPGGLEVGTKLRIVYRIKEPDKIRGFNRYFWKATPVAEGG